MAQKEWLFGLHAPQGVIERTDKPLLLILDGVTDPHNLGACLRTADAGVWVVGTAGEAEQLIYSCKLDGPTALVMGAEGKGMRRLTRENCDELIKLPMAGSVSSLNISVATGVCLYEIVRQRSV